MLFPLASQPTTLNATNLKLKIQVSITGSHPLILDVLKKADPKAVTCTKYRHLSGGEKLIFGAHDCFRVCSQNITNFQYEI
jgi:hypothetical protein